MRFMKAGTMGFVLIAALLGCAAPAIDSGAAKAGETAPAGSLPRVLIIGDSISIGYTKPVQEMLAGIADVRRIPANAGHTGMGLEHLDDWLGDTPWDVIHFNWGLWDLCYRHPDSKVQGNRDKARGKLTTPLDQYEDNLLQIVRRLGQTGALLIFATTTPVPPGEAGRFEGDAARYNEAAARVMNAEGIPINDLYSAVLPHMAKYQEGPGNVHFTREGSAFLAGRVAQAISMMLP